MVAVTDTGPLNYLIQLGLDSLLQQLYGRLLVPQGVLFEMSHPLAPTAVRDWASQPPVWAEAKFIQGLRADLHPLLGLGEREAISLAMQCEADVLLVDDFEARTVATAQGLAISGTLSVLIEGALQRQYEFEPKLAELKQLGFRMSDKVEAAAFDRYSQRKQQFRSRINPP
jgi:predicted nucleic acid-binding protein